MENYSIFTILIHYFMKQNVLFMYKPCNNQRFYFFFTQPTNIVSLIYFCKIICMSNHKINSCDGIIYGNRQLLCLTLFLVIPSCHLLLSFILFFLLCIEVAQKMFHCFQQAYFQLCFDFFSVVLQSYNHEKPCHFHDIKK